MRPLGALVLFVLIVFVGGALLAPWLYWLAQAASALWPTLAEAPFHRFVNRAVLGLALVGLWPLLRRLGITSWRQAGLPRPAGQWKRLAAGLALGFASLALVALVALLAGGRQWRADLTVGRLVGKSASALATATVVAVLEEVLFRGALFGALRRHMRWTAALLYSSGVYALAHFLASARLAGEVAWWSGLALLPQMWAGLWDWQQLVPGFLSLSLAGAWLALGYQRTGSLYFSIGLHAGWIFWLKLYGAVTVAAVGANAWWWGSHKLINGWLACGILLAGLGLYARATTPTRAPTAG